MFAISGGAQAFALAHAALSAAEQSRIGNVTYIDAVSNAATLPSGTGTTNWIMDWLDPLFPAGRPKGNYNSYFAYNSFHNAATIIGDFQTLLNSMRGSPCSSPQTVTPAKGTAVSTIHYEGAVGDGGNPGGGWVFFQPVYYGPEGVSIGTGGWIWWLTGEPPRPNPK